MEMLTDHSLIALDTGLWIYHLEEHPLYQKWTKPILQAINSGQCCAVSSEISLLEILVQPLRLGLDNVINDYKNLLDNFPNLTWCPVTREVTLQATTLRAKYRLRTPDALILATGITQGATLMITNDIQWKQVSEIQIICLRDLEEK